MRADAKTVLRRFSVQGIPWVVVADLTVLVREDCAALLGESVHPLAAGGAAPSIDHLSDANLSALVRTWSLTMRRLPLRQLKVNRWVDAQGKEILLDFRRFERLVEGRTVEWGSTGEGGPNLVIVSELESPATVVAVFSTLED